MRIVKSCVFLYYIANAGMVELVDTRDLKSLDGKMSCRSDSGSRQKKHPNKQGCFFCALQAFPLLCLHYFIALLKLFQFVRRLKS